MFMRENVGIRLVEEKDLEEIRALRNHPTTWIWLTSVQQINKIQQERWYEKICGDPTTEYYSIVEVKKEFPMAWEGEFLGIIRVTNIDLVNKSAMMGLDIKPQFRGEGRGTKAFKAALEYFFEYRNFHRLYLAVLETNHIARKLYENVGFKEEGIMREAVWRDGQYRDYIIMSILEEEYRRQSAL